MGKRYARPGSGARASSSVMVRIAIDSAAISPIRTTSCSAAAAVGEAPPSTIPTNAPGSDTSPTVRV